MWEKLGQPQIIASLVAAAASIVAAALSFYFSRSKAKSDARLDYEYEARKRLYQECQPIVFQHIAACAALWGRLSSMAARASEGHLDPGPKSWMHDNYYARSTVYRIFRVLALGQLLRSKLTLFDATLDANIFDKFIVSNILDDLISSHFDVAKSAPQIEYAPYAADRLAKRVIRKSAGVKPANIYQGLLRGEMQSLVELMIDDESRNRVMNWNDFDEALKDKKSRVSLHYRPLRELFWDFHPDNRPVLWRILVGYSLLSRALMANPDSPLTPDLMTRARDDVLRTFDHRPPEKRKYQSLLESHIDAVSAFIEARLHEGRSAFGAKPGQSRVSAHGAH